MICILCRIASCTPARLYACTGTPFSEFLITGFESLFGKRNQKGSGRKKRICDMILFGKEQAKNKEDFLVWMSLSCVSLLARKRVRKNIARSSNTCPCKYRQSRFVSLLIWSQCLSMSQRKFWEKQRKKDVKNSLLTCWLVGSVSKSWSITKRA